MASRSSLVLSPAGPGPLARASPRRVARTEGYVFCATMLVLFAAAAVDVLNFLDRGTSARYAILLIPVGAVVLIRLRRPSPFLRKPAPIDRILFALWGMGMVGTLYGVFVVGSPTTARPLFFPMSIAFLYLFVLEPPTDAEVRRLLRAVALIGGLYLVLGALVNSGAIPGLAGFKQFRNAQFAFVTIGLAGAIVLRRRWIVNVLIGLALVNFAAYPSATSLLATFAMIVTFFMTRPHASSLRPYVVGMVLAMVALLAVINISRGIEVTNAYFNLVGKVNASYGRLSLWSEGIDRFKESPFVGQVFAGGTVTSATRLRGGSTISLPYHNDYVLFLAEGGLLGFGLLIAFIVALEVTLVRRYQAFVHAGRRARADLLRVLLVGFNAFFVAAVFNPVLEGMSRSAVIFALYGVAMLVAATPPPVRSAAPPRPELVREPSRLR